jgi:anti-anti-sigma factor
MEWSEKRADPPWAIRIAVEHDAEGGGARTVLHVAGELDSVTIPAFERALPETATLAPRVVLDLSRVTFCSVVGVRALARLRLRIEGGGGRVLTVRRPNRTVRRVFALSGLAGRWGMGRAEADVAAAHGAHAALLTGTLEAAMCAASAPMGTAQYYEQATGVLHIVAHQGFGHRFVSFFETVEGRSTSCGAAADDLRPVFVEDVASSPLFAGTPELDVLLEASVGGVASVPIVSPARTLIGVVSTHHPAPRSWTADQRSALEHVGTHAAALA